MGGLCVISLGMATECFLTIWRGNRYLCWSSQLVLETSWRRWSSRTTSSTPTSTSSPTTWTLTRLWVSYHVWNALCNIYIVEKIFHYSWKINMGRWLSPLCGQRFTGILSRKTALNSSKRQKALRILMSHSNTQCQWRFHWFVNICQLYQNHFSHQFIEL